MYAITERIRKVEGQPIQTFSRQVVGFSEFEVEAGAGGPDAAGGWGNDCWTYFRLEDFTGDDLKCTLTPHGVVIEVSQASEMDCFIEALEFAVRVLKEQREDARQQKAP